MVKDSYINYVQTLVVIKDNETVYQQPAVGGGVERENIRGVATRSS
jgi:hypothetical protein